MFVVPQDCGWLIPFRCTRRARLRGGSDVGHEFLGGVAHPLESERLCGVLPSGRRAGRREVGRTALTRAGGHGHSTGQAAGAQEARDERRRSAFLLVESSRSLSPRPSSFSPKFLERRRIRTDERGCSPKSFPFRRFEPRHRAGLADRTDRAVPVAATAGRSRSRRRVGWRRALRRSRSPRRRRRPSRLFVVAVGGTDA